MTGSLIFTLINVLVNFSLSMMLILVLNWFDQKDSRHARKKQSSLVMRVSILQWMAFVSDQKRYSIVIYMLIAGVSVYSIVTQSPMLLTLSICLFLWKGISQSMPVTYIFDERGLHTWDSLMLYERKDTEDFYDWNHVSGVTLNLKEKTFSLKMGHTLAVHPLKVKQAEDLRKMLTRAGVRVSMVEKDESNDQRIIMKF